MTQSGPNHPRTGRAQVREWEGPEGTFEVSVTISNPLLGEFFGYEGFFTPADAGDDSSPGGPE